MNLWIGLSALRTSQFAINTVSHNLANASTEGYHRQDVGLQTSQSQYINGRFVGSGVEVRGVSRDRDQIVEGALTNTISDLSNINQRLALEKNIEDLLVPGEGSIQEALTGIFDELSRLSANPTENSLRNAVVNEGVSLASRIRKVNDDLVGVKQRIAGQIELEVRALNQEIEALVELQNRIRAKGPASDIPPDLLDQRDQLVNSIAERIDITRFESVQDKLGLGIAGTSISIGLAPIRFETVKGENGQIEIHAEGSDSDTKFSSGKILALTEAHNQGVEEFANRIDELAKGVMRQFDQAHATGVGLEGPFTVLRNNRILDHSDLPLDQTNLAFPVNAGQLYVSVTSPDGEKRTFEIEIDPSVDSLESIAGKISDSDGIQALIDPRSGQMSIVAAPGYGFDFTGNLETIPGLAAYGGSSIPRFGGTFSAEENRNYSFEINGSGTVGKTDGLSVRILDGEGNFIKELNIGNGYEEGTEIEAVDGITLSFGAGDVIDADAFATQALASSDSTGILSALGINNFFSGRNATDIGVNSEIVKNPRSISSSRSGEIGDTSNLADLIAVRREHTLENGSLTFDDFLAETNSEIGFRVQTSESLQYSFTELNYQYQAERDSVSGVDVNEELLNLTQHQKSYEAAVQVVRTMESMLDELFRIIG